MITKIVNKLENKNIAIVGYGREGKSTYEFIRKYMKNKFVTIIDKNKIELDDEFVEVIYGDNYLDNLESYDLIIKAPGVSFKDVDTTNINITSQIELILESMPNKVIGVTGTKGKSTTSSLIYSILKENNKDAILAGNIGVPILSMIEQIKDETIIVLEMSSHQLEFLNTSPHIGVVLNLFEDHLDHAGNVKHYHECKMHMFLNQIDDDHMIYCSDNETLNTLVNTYDFKAKKYTVSLNDEATIYLKDDKVYYNDTEVFASNISKNLLGVHNLENIMVAFLVSKILKLDDNLTLKAIKDFKSLPYRLENIGTVNDVCYYVDTLATIPEATIEAIEAIPNVNTLIFGGMDRGISYEGFAERLASFNIEHFICMPKTGHTIGKKLPQDKTFFVDNLEEACNLAKKITKKNTVCLLSPAAASYDNFKNYAEKGDKFKEYILK